MTSNLPTPKSANKNRGLESTMVSTVAHFRSTIRLFHIDDNCDDITVGPYNKN